MSGVHGTPERALAAPVHGAVIAIEVGPGSVVRSGQTLLLLEAMKMEVPIEAPHDGVVVSIDVAVGDMVEIHAPVLRFRSLREGEVTLPAGQPRRTDADHEPRSSWLSWQRRQALLADAARPEVVAARHAAGGRTARENVADLLDPGSFTEYGGFAVAAQRTRRTLDDLQRNTPADGLITGTGTVNGRGDDAAAAAATGVAVMAYDYTVLAGTQGMVNHRKSDRLLELAHRQRLALVLFAEGGGGRPGDVDWPGVAGLDCTTFARLAALSGQVPMVGVVHGRCFAGNAALLGCCDVIIATESASIGLGGPAMIEGGGLGRVAPDEVGPLSVQSPNGVVDLRVADESAAVAAAKQYLRYFQGRRQPRPPGGIAASLRHAMPESRNALYDVRAILSCVFDRDSVLELRREFGAGVITALAHLDGQPVAVVANQVHHLGGALDAPACDKLARFMQLADAHGLPLVSFVDTPGFMVGPASEKTAMVRHAGRVFVTAASLRVPMASVIMRRGYGLGAMAMTAGHFHATVATCAWPSGEFGGMGLEGAIKLGFRKELEAAERERGLPARETLFRELLQKAIDKGQALNMASHLEIDDVIDPADTRPWLIRVLGAVDGRDLPPRRGFVDAW